MVYLAFKSISLHALLFFLFPELPLDRYAGDSLQSSGTTTLTTGATARLTSPYELFTHTAIAVDREMSQEPVCCVDSKICE